MSVTPSSLSRRMSETGRVLVMAMSVTSEVLRPAAWQAAAILARTARRPALISPRRTPSAGPGELVTGLSSGKPDQAGESPGPAVAPVGIQCRGLGRAPRIAADRPDAGPGQLRADSGLDIDARAALRRDAACCWHCIRYPDRKSTRLNSSHSSISYAV